MHCGASRNSGGRERLAAGHAAAQLRVAATPPPMHSRLTELRDYVDAQRSALLAAAEALPRERWTERPAPDRWSMTELFEHLYKVEHGCARVIAKGATEARASGHPM